MGLTRQQPSISGLRPDESFRGHSVKDAAPPERERKITVPAHGMVRGFRAMAGNDDENISDEPPAGLGGAKTRKGSKARSRAARTKTTSWKTDHAAQTPKEAAAQHHQGGCPCSRSHPLAVGWLDGLFSDYLVVLLILTFFCCEIALPLAVLGAITAAERDARRNAFVVIAFGMLRFLLVLCLIGVKAGSRP